MREIHGHKVNPANDTIKITVMDEPGDGGANHHYVAGVMCPGEEGHWVQELKFQNGPIPEKGVNGITQEVLLAVIIDRLERFQSGPFACNENESALAHLRAAQDALHSRTRGRMERGVEGTHEV